MNYGVMAAGLCEVVERSPRGDGTVTRNAERCVTMNWHFNKRIIL